MGVSVRLFPVIGSIWPFTPCSANSISAVTRSSLPFRMSLTFCTQKTTCLCCTSFANVNQICLMCILHYFQCCYFYVVYSFMYKSMIVNVYVNVCIISPCLLLKTTNKLALAGTKKSKCLVEIYWLFMETKEH